MTIKRCYPVLVGASMVENQRIKSIDEEVFGSLDCSISKTDDVITAVPTSASSKIVTTRTLITGHKYFTYCQIKASEGVGAVWFWGGPTLTEVSMNDTWKDVYALYFYSGNTQSYRIDYGLHNNNNLVTYQVRNCMLIDLTAKFGSTIADYVYTLEQATAGSGIAWLRSYGFLKGYQAYNSGSIESVEVTGKKVVGFNQWDEEWELGTYINATGVKYPYSTKIRNVNPIRVLPNMQYYYHVGATSADEDRIWFYDADMTFISSVSFNHQTSINQQFTTPWNCSFINFSINNTTYNHDICINLSNPDRNGEYEPYKSISYPLGSDVLRGIFKLDANNRLYADGDRKEADGTVMRKYRFVDVSQVVEVGTSSGGVKYARVNTLSDAKSNGYVCTAKYPYLNSVSTDRVIRLVGINAYIYDNRFTDTTTANNILQGEKLLYELATPTKEQSTPFTSPQICDPDGTEEFVTENGVPVGHETKYQL